MSTAAESGRVIFYGAERREDVLASVCFVIKKKKDYKTKQQQYQAINEITHLGELSVHS